MFDLTIDGRIARLTLNRPEARNAVPADGWADLARRLGALGRARVLILGSAVPAAFCAGADIGDLAALADDVSARATFRTDMRAALDRLATLAVPTIAAVDGGCLGAGVALALACDIRLAGERARFAIPPAKLGISFPQEDVSRLIGLVGRGQAARLLFGAITIDAAEAARIGLVEQAAPDAGEAAEALAVAMAAGAPSSIAALKAAIEGASSGETFDAAFGSADFTEGLAAFRARRTPEFGA